MKRERVRIRPSARRRAHERNVLPLDSRDPSILRAKAIQRSALSPTGGSKPTVESKGGPTWHR